VTRLIAPAFDIKSQIEIRFRLVHVISQKAVRESEQKHADAAASLRAWLKLVRHGRFGNFEELRRTFASVDRVAVNGRDFYVFNVGGNNYRLIAAIHFNTQKLFVRHILTHPEYDTGQWKWKK
jgi:mRNA interferase HigB